MAKQRGLGTFSLTSILTPQESAPEPAETPEPSPEPPRAPRDTRPAPAKPTVAASSESRATPESPATQASPERHDTPETPVTTQTLVLPQTPTTPAPSERRGESGGTVRDTVYMPARLERRLANAVYWARMTQNAIFVEGVERVLAELEAANGGPFDDIPPQTILKHARAGRRRQ